MIEYFKSATDDPLFLRIVMSIWGLPFLAIIVYSTINFTDLCPDYWLFAFPAAIGALGVFLLYTALFTSDETVDKRADWLGDSGELVALLFIVAVFLVAIPVWELMKLLRSAKSQG